MARCVLLSFCFTSVLLVLLLLSLGLIIMPGFLGLLSSLRNIRYYIFINLDLSVTCRRGERVWSFVTDSVMHVSCRRGERVWSFVTDSVMHVSCRGGERVWSFVTDSVMHVSSSREKDNYCLRPGCLALDLSLFFFLSFCVPP